MQNRKMTETSLFKIKTAKAKASCAVIGERSKR
jgi:hypothetical protein